MKQDAAMPAAATRREFFYYAWIGALGISSALMGAMGVLFALPRFKKGQYGGIIDLGPVSQLPAVGDPPINFPAGKFWLVHTPGGLLALYRACTHLDCLFTWDPPGNRFICPCHGSQFTEAGDLLEGPAKRSLDRFVIEIVSPEGHIVSQTNLHSGAPLSVAALVPKNETISTNSGTTADETTSAPLVVRVDTGKKITGTSN